MKSCQNSKKHSRNKIVFYQAPLLGRIMALFSFASITLMVVSVPFISDSQDKSDIVAIIITIILDIAIYFMIQKTYLLFDIENNKFIAKSSGTTKMSILISDIKNFNISCYSNRFDLNIVLKNGSVINNIGGWSYLEMVKAVMIGAHERQVNRLYDFCQECNEYLDSQDKNC